MPLNPMGQQNMHGNKYTIYTPPLFSLSQKKKNNYAMSVQGAGVP